MANPTRRTRMLITGLLAGCLLGSLPRVIAQSAQPTQSDSASPATQTAGQGPFVDNEGKRTRDGAFADFVEDRFCMDRLVRQTNARTGQNHMVLDWEEINRTVIHLSQDEWSDVSQILTDTCQQLDDWRTHFGKAISGPDGEFPATPTMRTPEWEANLKVVNLQHPAILLGARESVKRALGEDSFKKFDDYVYMVQYGGRYITGAPPTKAQPLQNTTAPNER
jgi:hypothetical protein